jgi:hypothetical protein
VRSSGTRPSTGVCEMLKKTSNSTGAAPEGRASRGRAI